MKILFIATAILCLLSSCKKDSNTTTPSYNVSFSFDPDGNPSNILVTNEQTGAIQMFTNQTSITNVSVTARVGDKFILEMTGNADGLDQNYYIHISYDNNLLAGTRALGAAGIHQQDLKLEKVFLSTDFK